MATDIGIDLGTASILVYVKGKGVVLKEPSVVAFDVDTRKIKAIGEEARLMIGRTPGNIVAVRPLRQGVISDYSVTEKMLKYFVHKSVGKSLFGRKPRISVCVPSGVTEVEKKAVEDATYAAGARDVKIIEEPVAAAIGAGIDIAKPCGNMIVDIGGGTSDIAIFTEGAIRHTAVIPIAGDQVTNDIAMALRTPTQYAEEIKIRYACALAKLAGPGETIKVPSVGDRPPRELSRQALAEVVEPRYDELFTLILSELRRSGYEDMIPAGIVLTGGTSKMEGAVELAEEIFHMPVRLGVPQGVKGIGDVVRNPVYSTAVGLLVYGLRKQADGGTMAGKSHEQTEDKMAVFGKIKRWLQNQL